ncbi:hypothetical protein [Prescottella agglutinans]|uniref:Uncharacterized protein n=1 Tax=Prescottella agglutinans TaxID=1644129 RepID=A0ABT6MLQ9_9NOCA|nr:hypothetical protein [Prescottella agglutinans]MDH6284826.1 hypothetical protein [Prescottella agglutinans]
MPEHHNKGGIVRRALLAPTLIAAALLAGCGSDVEETQGAAATGGSEPSLSDDPLMACYGLVGFKERQNCVPGVGAMSARDVTVKLPEYAQDELGLYNHRKDAPSATINVGDRWLRAFLVPYQVASHGLTPAMSAARVEVFDLADRSSVTSIDLPNTKVNAILPDTDNGLFVVALTDINANGYLDNRDQITTTMAAVDPFAGKVLWQKDDLMTSNPDAVIDRGVLPVYGTPKGECRGKTIALTVQVLDTKTGDARWSKKLTDLRGPRDNDQCTADVVYADPRLPYIQVTREGEYPVAAPDANYNITTNLDVNTGAVFAPLPSEFIDFSRGGFYVDPVSPLTVVRITREGNYERKGGETGWLVFDRDSGTIVNRMPLDTLGKVNADIIGLYDSKLYLKNANVFALDARTNAEAGRVTSRPIQQVNGWTLHENGDFTKQ